MEVQEHTRYYPIIGIDLNNYHGRHVRYNRSNSDGKYDNIVGRLFYDNKKNLVTIIDKKKLEHTFKINDFDQVKLVYPREQYYATHGITDATIGRNTTIIPLNATSVSHIAWGLKSKKSMKSKKSRKSKKSKKSRKSKKY